MRNIYVAGVYMTRFGFLAENYRELAEEAVWGALKDSGLKPSDIEVAYCGYGNTGLVYNQEFSVGQTCLREIGIREIPILRVEQACNSGSCAFREGIIAIQSGLYDVALVFGVEKLTGKGTPIALNALSAGLDLELYGQFGLLPTNPFAMIARRHMYEFGTTKEQMALVSVKNRKHASLNPKAHFRKETTVEEVLKSAVISDPLTLFMCCPISDGGAAAILVSEDFMQKRNFRKPIKVAGSLLTSGNFSFESTLTHFEITVKTSRKLYEMAGIGPEDIDLAEVHDAFSIAEILHYEDLGFCPKGEGGRFIESGASALGGRVPFCPSGGLLSRGHPLGATGLAQIIEVVEQLRGEAGQRQVKDAKVGLTHCVGGYMMGDGASLTMHVFQR
jgi:acetyl-CoA acetyltransferase